MRRSTTSNTAPTMPSLVSSVVRLGPLALAIAVFSGQGCSGGDPSASVSPPPPAGASGSVQTASFASAALGVTKNYVVYLPPSYSTQTARRYPVVYMLHGSPGAETDWVNNLSINTVLDSLAHAGLPEVIAVMPDGDSWWYHDWISTPPACAGGSYTGAAPSEPCVPGLHYQYESYIVNDLIPRIDATYRTEATMAHRAIGGLSMGGYGAAYLALAHPDVFDVAAVFSGSRTQLLAIKDPVTGLIRDATSIAELQTSHGSEWPNWAAEYGTSFANWQAHDPSTQAATAAASGRRIPPFWIVVGSSDPLHAPDEEFNAVLTKVGATHVFSEPPGDHSNGFWRLHEGDGLAWVLQHIGS